MVAYRIAFRQRRKRGKEGIEKANQNRFRHGFCHAAKRRQKRPRDLPPGKKRANPKTQPSCTPVAPFFLAFPVQIGPNAPKTHTYCTKTSYKCT